MSQRRSKELGTEEYYNCTVVIRECFQPPPPFAVANQSHHSGDSHWRQTKTTSNAQLDIGIQKVVVLVLVARRPTGSPDSVCLVIWFCFFEMQCQIVWSALIWSNSSWASSQSHKYGVVSSSCRWRLWCWWCLHRAACLSMLSDAPIKPTQERSKVLNTIGDMRRWCTAARRCFWTSQTSWKPTLPSQILGVPSSHPSLRPSSLSSQLWRAQHVRTILSTDFCPSKQMPAFNNLLKQPFIIPNVHLTSFLMDKSHFENQMSERSHDVFNSGTVVDQFR